MDKKSSKRKLREKVEQVLKKNLSRKGFDSLTKKERKKFFSNNLVARMILLEQKFSASMGKAVPYNKTNYYKSLSKEEKEKFEKYLKRKRRRKFYLPVSFFLISFSFIFLRGEFIGQVVRENLGKVTTSFLEIVLALIFLLIILSLIVSFGMKKFKEWRFRQYFEILQDAGIKRIKFRKK